MRMASRSAPVMVLSHRPLSGSAMDEMGSQNDHAEVIAILVVIGILMASCVFSWVAWVTAEIVNKF